VTDGVVSGLDGCCAQTATERTSRATNNATGATAGDFAPFPTSGFPAQAAPLVEPP